MRTLLQARFLANYIEKLNDFQIINKKSHSTYNHMGAVLTDAILQSGLNYKHVVYPRIQHILYQYPSVDTTNAFGELLETEGPAVILRWHHSEKINRLYRLINLLKGLGIERELELKEWIIKDNNAEILLGIKGVGPKTVDYIKGLLDIQSVAVDRHIRTFVTQAGLEISNYNEIKQVVEYCADLLGLSRRTLDYSIWLHISNSKSRKRADKKQTCLPS